VQHAAVVGVGDGLADLHERREQPALRPLLLGAVAHRPQHLAQRATRHPLHHEVDAAVVRRPDLVDGDDVGVLQLAGDLGLGDEASELGLLHGVGVQQQLDGDAAAQLGVARLEHPAHAAATELLAHLEAAKPAQLFDGVVGGEGQRVGQAVSQVERVVERLGALDAQLVQQRARPQAARLDLDSPLRERPGGTGQSLSEGEHRLLLPHASPTYPGAAPQITAGADGDTDLGQQQQHVLPLSNRRARTLDRATMGGRRPPVGPPCPASRTQVSSGCPTRRAIERRSSLRWRRLSCRRGQCSP
jgi:hypothetical protein